MPRSNKILGIDISDRSIELVEVAGSGAAAVIAAKARIELKAGIVENGQIALRKELAGIVKDLMQSARPRPIEAREAVFGLPDSVVFAHLARMPHDFVREDVEAIAHRTFPLDKADMAVAYKKINLKDRKNALVLILAASQEQLNGWHSFFREIGLRVKSMEFEPVAAHRGLFKGPTDRTVCLLDIGANTVSASFFNDSGLVYFYNTFQAGYAWTKKIAIELKTSLKNAERLKKDSGLAAGGQAGAVSRIISDGLDEIFKNLKKNIEYFKKISGEKVSQVVVIGGGAKLKGLPEYLNNFERIKTAKDTISKEEEAEYIEAAGLALIGADPEAGGQSLIRFGRRPRRADSLNTAINKIKQAARAGAVKYKKPIIVCALLSMAVFALVLNSADRRPESGIRPEQQYPYYIKLPVITGVNIFFGEAGNKAKIIKITTENPKPLEKLLEDSRRQAERSLKSGQKIWPQAVNAPFGDKLTFPLTAEWFAYDEDWLKALLADEAKVLFDEKEILLEAVEINSLERSGSEGEFIIYGQILAYSKIDKSVLEKAIQDSRAPAPAPDKKIYIKVKDLGGLNLNVRQGPGTDYPILGQALSLAVYEAVRRQDGWVKINLDNNVSGWVSAEFVQDSQSPELDE